MSGSASSWRGSAPALIVVDMQNGFCHRDGFLSRLGSDNAACAAVIEPVGRLVEAARAAGAPVIWTRHVVRGDYADAGLMIERVPAVRDAGGMIAGSWDGDLVEQLVPRADEPVIDKTRYSAFYETPLAELLDERAVDTAIVCGVTTECCVESTARDAFFRDLRVLVPADATATSVRERHDAALDVIEAIFGAVAPLERICDWLAR